MASWHGWQTTRDFLRFFVIRAAHAGWSGPGRPSRTSLATWWTTTRPVFSHSSHLLRTSLLMSSLRG